MILDTSAIVAVILGQAETTAPSRAAGRRFTELTPEGGHSTAFAC